MLRFAMAVGGACVVVMLGGHVASGRQTPAAAPSAVPAPVTPPKEPAWDVANPPTDGSLGGWGWKDVSLDVDEGTWMSVDISPDGRTIAFDLLGDLYTMPIEGSADGSGVRCVSEGIQWDMQPRFSPDGKWIAFVSDRTGENGKGGDNIWIMKPDGTGLRQISKEGFRLVTQPVWMPDSEGIVARKHFTSRRSLGAGEMWLYHVSGKTDGLQLTAKQSEQKDTGEPAVSADGRYLYYSLDATGGPNFEYDKDGNGGIYAIDRLDLRTQRTERVVAGPGGACRPVPSPDGKSLAFVRRVRYQSTLFVLDLASGRAREVYSPLERDNQETWAVHGVYPAMAWTPDGGSLVFWAKGKIHRLDLKEGQAPADRVIPFRVKSTRRLAEAIRFGVDVAPERFDVKMIRNAEVAPGGDRIVFQALGHVYTATYSDSGVGEPKRLTATNDEFEFFPTWSRDGKWIAYASWNDARLGSIKVAPSVGGEGMAVTEDPGHYVNPAFTPDSTAVVYEKTGGGYVTSPLWSTEQGVYVARIAGGAGTGDRKPRLISRRGELPHFGSDKDRVYLTARAPESDSDKVSLISVPLGGATPDEGERTLYRSEWATEMRVSPDGKYLAFAERYRLYATPFIGGGKPIDIGPKASGVPVVQLSSEAGSGIHWSGDSSKVRWSLGPEVFTASAAESIAAGGFSAAGALPAPGAAAGEGDAKEAKEATRSTSARIDLKARQDIPTRADGTTSMIAITNVKILTMEDASAPSGESSSAGHGMKVIDRGTIVVTGNRITAVGASASVAVPPGATVIDGKGATVTPGFIDVHAHGSQGEHGVTPQRNWVSHANLGFGVTTIHDPSNDSEMIFSASELARTGAILTPRIFSTGTILYGAQGSYKTEIESLDDALFHLRRMKAVGAFSVKSYNQPRRDQRQMYLEAARRVGLMVVPEGGALFAHNMTMVVDGHTSVEHTLPVENIYKDVTTLWGASQTGYTPTLVVAYGGVGGENYWYAKTRVWEDEHLMHFVPRYVVDPRSRRRVDAPDEEWNHIKEARVAKMVLDAKARGVGASAQEGGLGNKSWGGPTVGAHGQLAGLAAHWEIWMLVQGGMTPMEALRAATIDGAWYVGLDKDLGSIAEGKLADLAIFAEDPSVDIRKTSSIRMVMLNGRLYNAGDLAQVAPVSSPAPSYFFEDLQRGSGTPLAVREIMARAAANGGVCKGCGRDVP